MGVSPRTVTVPAGDKNLETALRLMIDADRKSAYPLLPTGLSVKEVYVKDGTATVNFSKELKNLQGGSTAEGLFIDMTVDTLTEFPDVKNVVFHMEGMPIKKLTGHRDMTAPFKRDEKTIQK